LMSNTNLRDLYVDHYGHNIITKTGWLALRKAEFDDTSLNSAADSNHTCRIHYPYSSSSNDEVLQGLEMSEMNGTPRHFGASLDPVYVRQKKIYCVLSSRNRNSSNVEHFEDLPFELLPNLLSLIEQYSNYHIAQTQLPTWQRVKQSTLDVKPLSIVYEVLQKWDKSRSVFESLSS